MVHELDADVERSYNNDMLYSSRATDDGNGGLARVWFGLVWFGGGERTGQTLPMSGRHGSSILDLVRLLAI